MGIAIAGGTGTVGSSVTGALVEQGASVRILSRRPRPVGDETPAQWATVDYRSGAGLADALAGIDTVVFTIGGMRDSAAVSTVAHAAAPNTHLLYLSIVGIDDLPMPYYKAKLAGEKAVSTAGRPWTILRATQFHQLVFTMMHSLAISPVMPVPQMSIQPVAADEVAAKLADLVTAPAVGRTLEFGGPQIRAATELAGEYLRATGTRRRLVTVAVPGALGRGFAAGANMTEHHRDGRQTFAEYVAARTAR